MAWSSDFLERVKAANPIVEVMGSYVTLKRTGRDHICLCPFHNEKTPSCHVHADKEFFHCFGCGAGGDVITFMMKYNNLDYVEAVTQLAERAGIPVPDDRGFTQKTDKRKRMYEMNKEAARFFYSQLKTENGRNCVQYLLNTRKLKPETVKKYGMGYAPKSWSALKTHLLSMGYTEQEMLDGSLIMQSSKTKNTFDFFVDRAMFPFIDLAGHIVGFGGRALSSEDKRKYLNSRDSACYSKTKFLFSMNFAKNASVKSKQILLCEGNLDVISLNQYGFENAVASCGTALTPEQARLISNYADEVIICYDSDEAGQKATDRAIGILREVGLKTSVLHMEGAKDPDEYINKFGADHFNYLIKNCHGAVEYELEKCADGLDTDTETGKLEYLRNTYKVLAAIASPVERDLYISKVAREQGINKELIVQEINMLMKKKFRGEQKRQQRDMMNFTDTPRDIINPQANAHRREALSEEGIINYLYYSPDALNDVASRIKAEEFVTDFNRRVFDFIVRHLKSGEDHSMSTMNMEFTPDEVGKIAGILEKEMVSAEVLYDYINNLKVYNSKLGQDGEPADEDYIQKLERLRREKNVKNPYG